MVLAGVTSITFFWTCILRKMVLFECPISGMFPSLSEDDSSGLFALISKEEVYGVLFDIEPSKASGIDGFSPYLYQSKWLTIGYSLA